MASCAHTNLTRLPEPEKRLRCRHCHLSMTANDLEQDYCPECFEINGEKRYDFETLDAETSASVKYRCEDCGVIIESA